MGLRPASLRLAAAPLLLALGCSYTSQYTAPADGRVRPVWHDDRVLVEPSGAAPSAECSRAALDLTRTDVLRQPKEYGVVRREAYWVPRYFGPPIVVAAGLGPVLPRPPLFVPVLVPLRPGVAVVGAAPALRLGSGGGDSGKALALLAVIALVVLPVVDVVLAAAPAESVSASAQAIDQVNALNDLMRSDGTPCSYYSPPGGAP